MTGPVVHTYRAAATGLYANSYLVEGEPGLVVVDTNADGYPTVNRSWPRRRRRNLMVDLQLRSAAVV
jgi:hypothetical protein